MFCYVIKKDGKYEAKYHWEILEDNEERIFMWQRPWCDDFLKYFNEFKSILKIINKK